MLSKGDDYPIHQTPEPIAYAGTDRNFYDRYFFNGYTPDGAIFFAVAFGVYPHANIADAHISVIVDGVQHCLHASRFLYMERMDLTVGPIRIIVEQPLRTLRIIVEPTDGIAADLCFEGRAFPIEEPRFIRRLGPRSFFDYTRMTQNGRYSGWIEIDGKRANLPETAIGTRDRSWGVRPIGAPDAQQLAPAMPFSLFWMWTPVNLAARNIFFHDHALADGSSFNKRAAIMPDGGQAGDVVEAETAQLEISLIPGTRHAAHGVITMAVRGEPPLRVTLRPFLRFQMKGIGYGHPKWGHGAFHGPMVVERESFELAGQDLASPVNLHIQALCRVTVEQEGEAAESGTGVFEQVIIGPYAPLRLTGLFDRVDV